MVRIFLHVLSSSSSSSPHPMECDEDDTVEIFQSLVFSITEIEPEDQHFPTLNPQIFSNLNNKTSLLHLTDGQHITVQKRQKSTASATSLVPTSLSSSSSPSPSPSVSPPQLTPQMLAAALQALPLLQQFQSTNHQQPLRGGPLPSSSSPSSHSPPPSSTPTSIPFQLDLSSCCTRSFFGPSPLLQPSLISRSSRICMSCAQTCKLPNECQPPSLIQSSSPFICQCADANKDQCLFSSRSLISADLLPSHAMEAAKGKLSEFCTQQRMSLSSSSLSPSTQQFINRVKMHMKSVEEYENPDWQREAKERIPIEEIEKKTKITMEEEEKLRKENPSTSASSSPPLSYRDEFSRQLMHWFKHSFFQWVNSPKCEKCDGETKSVGGTQPNMAEAQGRAGIVELHQCNNQSCRHITRFPRYNHPVKLLSTRRGRCGEWANCFALICRSMGYDVRTINDWTDHIWVELYSHDLKRWIHYDCCENSRDNNLLYEAGWGKKLNYCIATSVDEAVDVTRKYTKKYDEVITRRTLISEETLKDFLHQIRQEKLTKMSEARRFVVEEKWRKEEEQMDQMTKAQENEKQREVKESEMTGRITGSVEWREMRGEMGDREKTLEEEKKQQMLKIQSEKQKETDEKNKEKEKAKNNNSKDPIECSSPSQNEGKTIPIDSTCTVPPPSSPSPLSSISPSPPPSSPDSSAKDKEIIRQMFVSYHKQLTSGCGDVSCGNEYCRSSKQFKYSNECQDNDNQKTKQLSLLLVKEHKGTKICGKMK